jgi:pyridoxal phosphate enzyme (YggS family)
VTGERDVASAVAAIRTRIEEACAAADRDPAQVTLIGASKTVVIERIRAAHGAGVRDFAENYAGELASKAPRVAATWHFIGKLQRGTVGKVAEHASMVHTAEPGSGFDHLAGRMASLGRSMPVLVQVDFTGRRQGVDPTDVEPFVAQSIARQGISVVGLMTLPPLGQAPEEARPYFRRLRELRDALRERHPEVALLSMGMSSDFPEAVEEGATMVRVGTALFGSRP